MVKELPYGLLGIPVRHIRLGNRLVFLLIHAILFLGQIEEHAAQRIHGDAFFRKNLFCVSKVKILTDSIQLIVQFLSAVVKRLGLPPLPLLNFALASIPGQILNDLPAHVCFLLLQQVRVHNLFYGITLCSQTTDGKGAQRGTLHSVVSRHLLGQRLSRLLLPFSEKHILYARR